MFAAREVVAAAPAAPLLAGLALAGLLGCVHQPTPPAPQPAAAPVPPAPGVTPSPSPPAVPPAASASRPPGAATPAPPPDAPPRPAAGTAPPAPKRAASTPAPAASPAPAATARPAPAALDLASLEQRLRDTHAIGVFTKLSLKNQVDDLLAQFRAFYAGQGDLTLAGLRRTYELLLMKVVTLLQDEDPGLASAVMSSREAIWALLSDRNRFNNL